jgi:hypothetical protein
MEDRKGRSMKTPIYLGTLGMDLMDFMDQTLIHEILLSHAAVALVDQDRQDLILLIHFAKLDVTTRQALPYVCTGCKHVKLLRSLRAVR